MSVVSNQPPVPDKPGPTTPPGFDFSRPLSGNTQMYKMSLRALRSGGGSGPKPYRLAKWARRLWMPLDLVGLIGVIFFAQGPLFFDWALVAGIIPRFVLEVLTLLTLLPRNFFGRPITLMVVGFEVLILVYLIALGLGFTFLVWAAPVLFFFLFWRIARRTGGMVKTMGLVYKAMAAMADAQPSAPVGAGSDDLPAAPAPRMRMVSRSSADAATKLSSSEPEEKPL
jgi:hypothetical protein